ncbi:DUF4389 domain-containing protein [Candidatus Woesearchaeota archaeon]|nr:DUF4389 domain-containing protein [Candidatus Woesearchaeota archaeon]
MEDRLEAILRIPIGLICGIILGLWKVVIQVVVIVHWVYAIVTGKRNKGMAEFCNKWVTYVYNFLRYMTFATNKRPFPFDDFGKEKDKVDMK